MEKEFSPYSTNVSIDRGQFRLPKDFQDAELHTEEFVIIRYFGKTLRIMTKKTYEEKYAKGALPKDLIAYSPSKCMFDKQWRAIFSQIHLNFLDKPSEVQMQGIKDFISVSSLDSNAIFADTEERQAERDIKNYGGDQ